MIDQPNAPRQASASTLATTTVRAHITLALRDVADLGTGVTLPDGGPITATVYGRTIEITTRDITDQPNKTLNPLSEWPTEGTIAKVQPWIDVCESIAQDATNVGHGELVDIANDAFDAGKVLLRQIKDTIEGMTSE